MTWDFRLIDAQFYFGNSLITDILANVHPNAAIRRWERGGRRSRGGVRFQVLKECDRGMRLSLLCYCGCLAGVCVIVYVISHWSDSLQSKSSYLDTILRCTLLNSTLTSPTVQSDRFHRSQAVEQWKPLHCGKALKHIFQMSYRTGWMTVAGRAEKLCPSNYIFGTVPSTIDKFCGGQSYVCMAASNV